VTALAAEGRPFQGILYTGEFTITCYYNMSGFDNIGHVLLYLAMH
jgi:hypothetical protein